MDDVEHALVSVSAAVGCAHDAALTPALEAAVEIAGLAAVEEVVLQSYLFVGFPAAINAMSTLREIRSEPAATSESIDGGAGTHERFRARGEAVCKTIYGKQYERLRQNVRSLHPDLEHWMLDEGYGKVLARPGLPLRTRELAIIALLACQDAPAQLHSHLRGALNAGAHATDIDAVLGIVQAVAPDARATAARALWDSIRTPHVTPVSERGN